MMKEYLSDLNFMRPLTLLPEFRSVWELSSNTGFHRVRG